MKFNKWTLGLAAVGAVSMASAVRADEAKMSVVNTALSSTTLSGYVDVAATYEPGNAYSGSDGFTHNEVDIALDKPLDDSSWAAGYHVELDYGDSYVYSGYDGLRQAYVTVRTPIGNGIDWKMGVMDNVIGYEGNSGYTNPNFTRSYGYDLEPTTLVGLIGTYKVCSIVSVTGGIAESYTGSSDTYYYPYANEAASSKTLIGTTSITAPESWGWAQGAALTIGAEVNDYNGGANNYYVGLTLPTPIKALKLGFAFDDLSFANNSYASYSSGNYNGHYNEWAVGVYSSFQATDKLSLNLRGEYFSTDSNDAYEEVTATLQYNLWANVLSRAEFRWDHSEHNLDYTQSYNANNYTLAFNLVYTF